MYIPLCISLNHTLRKFLQGSWLGSNFFQRMTAQCPRVQVYDGVFNHFAFIDIHFVSIFLLQYKNGCNKYPCEQP